MSKALLVIDLQNDYFPGGAFPLWNAEGVLDHVLGTVTRAGAPPPSSTPAPRARSCTRGSWRRPPGRPGW